jgi:hypothetical protein
MEANQVITMKEDLMDLYSNNQPAFSQVQKTFPHDDLAGPFLMSPSLQYQVQKNPLLVIGQETNGWTYFADDLQKQMKTYEEFQVGRSQVSSAFWKLVRRLEEVTGNAPHSCAWTNLSKFDLYGRRAYGKYEKAIASLDHLVAEEIKIAAPKICLFFTGPYFDGRLTSVFENVEFIEIEGWPVKQFCRLKHPLLPELTFRSYHPKSLRLRNLESNFINYMAGLDLA